MALATLLARDAGEKLWTKEDSYAQDDAASLPPMFVTQPQDVTCYEGQPAHFDCRVEPVGDGSMTVDWFHNGQPIQIGSRTHTINDFGFVVLDIDWTFKRDSGVYKCVVTNRCGSTETSTRLECVSKKDVSTDANTDAISTMCMVHMEKAMQKYTTEMYLTEDDVYDSERMQKPRFMSKMRNVSVVQEMQAAKFEVQLAPVGDPNMKVEWFFNGEPLIAKTQFTLINDFGYVALNFGWVYRQDSGDYMCRATNTHGSEEIKATLVCHGKTGIIYETQLPEGMTSMAQIQDMELKFDKPWLPEDQGIERSKPCFMTKPEPVLAVQGSSARFCCRVTGYPKPRVMWLINGQTIINGARRKLIFDGMWHMEIPRVAEGGKIEVIARNQCGEAYATTTLKVRKRRDDFRKVLKDDRSTYEEVVASKVYRKPVWMVEMEEIKERLAAVVQAAKITKEIQTNRVKAGMAAEFAAGISGNPRPEVVWWFQGKPLEESEAVKVTVKDDCCILALAKVTKEMAGVYECRIQNKLSSDKTKASLIVASE